MTTRDQQTIYIGVTGTNGKTSVTWMISHILRSLGRNVLLIGTLGAYLNGEVIEDLVNTTPAYHVTNRLVVASHESIDGPLYVVMEVSSIGIHQGRVENIDFQYGIFTNLSRDHLDYHGSMEEYFAQKLRLFTGLVRIQNACAIINDNCAFGQKVSISLPTSVETITTAKSENPLVSYFRKHIESTGVTETFIGSYNYENILQASVVAAKIVDSKERVLSVLGNIPPIPGRVNFYKVKGIDVVIDYAHSPDGLQRLLEALRPKCTGRLICVFGCGGDRDVSKRPVMGRIAEKYSDVVVITSDNPRSEDPDEIIRQISLGVQDPSSVMIIPDRLNAIKRAITDIAKSGDLVVLAGKGHESYQILGKEKIHFDESEILSSLA